MMPSAPMRGVLDRVMVSAVRARQQVAPRQPLSSLAPTPRWRSEGERANIHACFPRHASHAQVDGEKIKTAAGRTSAIRLLTTELNAFYSIEQLLRSKVIRKAVAGGLELHAAVLDEQSGVVKSLGPHPALAGLLDEERY